MTDQRQLNDSAHFFRTVSQFLLLRRFFFQDEHPFFFYLLLRLNYNLESDVFDQNPSIDKSCIFQMHQLQHEVTLLFEENQID